VKRHSGGPQGNKTTFTLPKNLTQAEAFKKTVKKKGLGRNWRGMKYDKKTGKTTVI
jgi:hypothetical protein